MPHEATALRALLPVARQQGGLITTRQAEDVGVSRRALSYYTRRGDLKRIAYGLYRVEWLPPHRHEDLIAACLWVGPDAAVSHTSALVVYRLTDVMPARIHVTAPRAFTGRRRGVVVHRAPLDSDEVSVRNDVPATTLPRTLADLVDQGDADLARDAVADACEAGMTSPRRLAGAVDRYPSLTQILDGTSSSRT
ncbi:MAG: type IV toxin-antitoxin system AbiEi family antitoxin domain-containing protein [Egibacteraceae bacterium]